MAAQLPSPAIVAQKYQLVRLVGQGGMGAVYEARNADTRGRCALKLLRPEFADNVDFKRRFLREAHAYGVVSSDHIVKVFDSGTDSETGCPYLVMEFLEGEDLEAAKGRLGALNLTASLKVVLQAATGLARAHEAGIVHRDIKPANLFLTTNDAGGIVVKILDFGIAKMKMEQLHETSNGLTRSQALLGTPLYMSPEQCKGASNIDARSDVWSLGVVLWELLAGSSPFSHRRSLGALMASIITEDLPLLQDAAPWVSAQVAELVHRAMSRDMEKRFQNAAELRDALQSVAPDGAFLPRSLLTELEPAQRSFVAKRLQMRDTSMLSASEAGGLARRSTAAVQRRSVKSVLAIVGLAALLGAGVAAQFTPRTNEQVASSPRPTATSRVDSSRPAQSGAPAAALPWASSAPLTGLRTSPEPPASRRAVRGTAPSASASAIAAPPAIASAQPAASPGLPEGMRTDTREFPP